MILQVRKMICLLLFEYADPSFCVKFTVLLLERELFTSDNL